MYKTRNKGFTLIELIIGITILSLLAIGLLAALDPAEQFAKARDTSTRNTLLEIYGALQRYEAAQESYPAGVASMINNTAGNSLRTNVGGVITYTFSDAVAALTTSGELKANFKNAAGSNLERIYLFKDIGGGAGLTDGKIMVCFRPTSKSFQLQAGQYTAASAVLDPASWAVASKATAPDQTGTECASPGTSLTARTRCVYCAQ
jgi:prepilin-type N-terminal cleavage/methylation domain-containing protein